MTRSISIPYNVAFPFKKLIFFILMIFIMIYAVSLQGYSHISYPITKTQQNISIDVKQWTSDSTCWANNNDSSWIIKNTL